MEDSQIIELYWQRDEAAIAETHKKYGKFCRGIAKNILTVNEDAEECVSDTYVGIWNAIPPERPNNLTAFVCRVARNLSLKRFEFLQREKRSGMTLVALSELEEVLADEDLAPNVDDEAIGECISRFLRTQKEDARNVFIRKYYFFDSIRDIANRYSFSESKVKNMLLHTRNKLKDYLRKEGIEL